MTRRLQYLRRILAAYVYSRKTSNLAFWHTPLAVNELTEADLKGCRAYPQDFRQKIGRIHTTDDRGVIMLDYKGDLGLQYNPNAAAQLALGYYDRILDGDDRRAEFLTQAGYFLDHGRLVDGVLLWEYDFPFQMRNELSPPWRSALAQGQGISVCLRAFQVSRDERYLTAARQAYGSFRHAIDDHPGGVLDHSLGRVWLEEYIVTPPNHVLNGFVWALWGVRDYAAFFQDDEAWGLWENGLSTLRENLKHYDLGFWTSYDLVRFNDAPQPVMPCSVYYQNLHVVQMVALHALTGEAVFLEYAVRWRSQLNRALYKWLSQGWKAWFKLRWF